MIEKTEAVTRRESITARELLEKLVSVALDCGDALIMGKRDISRLSDEIYD